MARVFTAKAAKDYPQHGIKKGETYYYWTPGFRGVKQMSKTPPKASQLTTSKMSEAYAAGEDLEEALDNASCIEDITGAMEEAIDRIRSVASEYEEASQAETGNGNRVPNADEMEEKASSLNDWADSIESDKSDVESMTADEYADMDTPVDDLPSELIDEDDEECGMCAGTGKFANDKCDHCDGTGRVQVKKRKEVSEFDDLTDEEKQAMLDAALETARNNVDCPV